VTLASTNELLAYLADLVEELERYAVTLLPPADSDEITLGQELDGSLVIDLEGRLPMSRRSRDVDLELFERWQLTGPDEWACVEYAYELRHHEIGYRRAFHRHDEDHFVRMHGVATHEHCEATIGVEVCGHYHGLPVADAFDGFRRLYHTWLTDQRPDCLALVCLG
jgi:hypothetical protein